MKINGLQSNKISVLFLLFLHEYIYICICATQHLGELVLGFLDRELQPSCLLACLETVRILSRDKNCLDPFTNQFAMSTLARYASIAVDSATTPAHSQSVDGQGN